ncbi:hypothetical protein [Paenibacillus sp.]|uniref:hypothetical protein n=1 Tax=Paenibacillus sp. TaxID=58172 RepID=UPI0028AE3DC0|nr:hypothetical protein [Paenibacillus sp.]
MNFKKYIGLILASTLLASIFLLSGCADDKPKSLKNATQKEYNDFMKWDAKQQQKKRDSSPAFGK